jgi:hypothetical protein
MSTLDLSNYEASSGVPKGEFPVRVTSAKMKKSRNGDDYLNLEMAIVGDKFKGYKVYENLNIFNANQDAQRIAREKLVNLLESLELGKSIDTNDLTPLLNKVVKAKLKEDGEYAKVVNYKKHEEESKGEVF